MHARAATILAAGLLIFAPPASQAALAPYTQNFESLIRSSPTALGDDGWLVYGNVFLADGTTFLYGYGPFPAPNGSGAFCAIGSCTQT